MCPVCSALARRYRTLFSVANTPVGDLVAHRDPGGLRNCAALSGLFDSRSTPAHTQRVPASARRRCSRGRPRAGPARRSRRRCRGRRPAARTRRACCTGRSPGPPGAGRAGTRRPRRSASTASASCGPQSQRAEPKTSPVRHSECGRTSGTSPGVPRTNARCSPPSARPRKVTASASTAMPPSSRSGIRTRVRTSAVMVSSPGIAHKIDPTGSSNSNIMLWPTPVRTPVDHRFFPIRPPEFGASRAGRKSLAPPSYPRP